MNDLIDREQAIKLLDLNKPNVDEKTKYAMWQFDKDLQTIITMPSAEKTGEWIPKGQNIFCSVCGEESACNWYGASKFSNYCPNCGAKMEVDNA